MFLVNMRHDDRKDQQSARWREEKVKIRLAKHVSFPFARLYKYLFVSMYRIVQIYKSVHSIYQVQIRPRPMSIGDWRNRSDVRSIDAIDRKISRVGWPMRDVWSSEVTEGTRAISSRPRDKVLKGLLSLSATGTAPFVQLISVRDFAPRR